MPKLASSSPDRIAEYFVTYLTREYADRRHVRRVASWVGMIVTAIRRGAGRDWRISNSRQLWFTYENRTFKVRYDHHIGNEGGIEIVEVLPRQGNPDGKVLATFANLEDVERFYNQAPVIFQDFAHELTAA